MFYVICQEDNCPSCADDRDEFEAFDTQGEAVERAKELAEINPGHVYLICLVIAEASCPVGDAEVTALLPMWLPDAALQ